MNSLASLQFMRNRCRSCPLSERRLLRYSDRPMEGDVQGCYPEGWAKFWWSRLSSSAMKNRERAWCHGALSACIAGIMLFSIPSIGQVANPTAPNAQATSAQIAPAQPAPATPNGTGGTLGPESGNAPLPQDPAGSSPQQSSPQQSSPQPMEKDDGGMFVMRKQVNEVALHATVIDDRDRIITGLDRSAFTVFEDGRLQTITSFRREDVPVSLGILIDNSGSMREKRANVEAAALNLVRASNPDDEVLIVNFNDEGILDQDFTADIGKLKEALERHESRGSTAIYDAVDGTVAHLKGSSTHEKKVIFVVTDGEDNASRDSIEKVLQLLEQEGAPTVYAIGLLDKHFSFWQSARGGSRFFPSRSMRWIKSAKP